jgi:ion channel-forming bestrophin family protein
MWVEKKRHSWFVTVVLGGFALPKIWTRTLIVTALSILVTVLYKTVPAAHVSLTATPFSLIGFALGIYLGFRNNTAYDRFWEARKLWGALVNTSRSFARQVLTFVDGEAPETRAMQVELVHLAIGFALALRHHLRDHSPWEALDKAIGAEAVAAVRKDAADDNVPLAVLARLGAKLATARRKGWLDPLHAPLLEASLTSLTDIQGACERIKSTPIPYSYTVLMHRLVAVYCGLLPLGLTDTIGWATPAVVLLMSYTFFGLDAIGDEVEQPFGVDINDLPLDAIARGIERNLRQRLGEEPPPVQAPQRGVLT